MDIEIGTVQLTENQTKKLYILNETHKSLMRGLKYEHDTGKVTVNSKKDLSVDEKQLILSSISDLADTPPPKTRLEEIKEKIKPTLDEVIEGLKIQGIL